MITEVYIEDYRLDVSKDLSTLINFAIDDVKDFSARSTTWSKTIILPGTANNNKLFGHIFEVGQENGYDATLPNVSYNFNAAKAASCIIFQDNIQTFKGVLRLLKIINLKDQIEYEVACFGELTRLNVILSSRYLEDLDFSAYNHAYTLANILASWDATPGSGYLYPLIDYGTYSTDKHNWKVGTFRPALYVKEYVDKIFTAAGFTYSSDLFNTDRFKRLIIPNNRKDLQKKVVSDYLKVSGTGSYIGAATYNIAFPTHTTLGNFLYTSGYIFSYNALDSILGNVTLEMNISYTKTSGQDIFIELIVSGTVIGFAAVPTVGTSGTNYPILIKYSGVSMTTADDIRVRIYSVPGGVFTVTVNSASILYARADAANIVESVTLNATFDLNYNLPKGIKQIDFLISLVKLFNLYIYEDQFDPTKLYIKPYVDFYSRAENVDWTYKMNRDKPITVTPMSELNAKIYEFKFKPDSDYWNDLYKKRYAEDYGNRTYDSEFEFAKQTESFEVIFSPTPLVGYLATDKVYSSIFKRTGDVTGVGEESTDSNIRILQTKKITGVTSWNILSAAGAVLSSQTAYLYAGHLDNPTDPDNDLNFGATKELFFPLAAGNLSVNQFNVYWSEYMADITDKDSKLLSAYFYLTPKDIFELNFAKYVFIDGINYRLNKIEEYNASMPEDCRVELLKVSLVPGRSALDLFDVWSQDGENYVDDGSGNDIQITI